MLWSVELPASISQVSKSMIRLKLLLLLDGIRILGRVGEPGVLTWAKKPSGQAGELGRANLKEDRGRAQRLLVCTQFAQPILAFP